MEIQHKKHGTIKKKLYFKHIFFGRTYFCNYENIIKHKSMIHQLQHMHKIVFMNAQM